MRDDLSEWGEVRETRPAGAGRRAAELLELHVLNGQAHVALAQVVVAQFDSRLRGVSEALEEERPLPSG